MIDAKQVTRHMRRLAALQGADAHTQTGAGARYDARAALMAAAESDAHAEAIVARLLAIGRYPAAGEIDTMADLVRPPRKLRAADPDCEVCVGIGYVYPKPGFSAVAVCPCRLVTTEKVEVGA